MPGSVSSLLRSDRAAPPRTLVDVLRATAERHGDEAALDDGRSTLTYAELCAEAEAVAGRLRADGVGRGDRVGVRIPSGTNALYVAILGVLHAGAAYVPVDVDDPDDRADLIFAEAGVRTILAEALVVEVIERGAEGGAVAGPAPAPEDDAWVIFTSGSTGVPKGVAVTHRSAAAFVDAEARLFLEDDPIGPDDRVLAGLSVAFDASCEEMWLAWRHGACLVPAPRSLVRSGMDLGPWLVSQGVTVVSTVPTLAAMWPDDALEQVRLLIFGGEACPSALADRLAAPGREVWNTYGPTEATVVACAALLTADGTVRIGLPLDGWDLAVVDPEGRPVPDGGTGELIIGGVGLARYLDADKDAERYAPMPTVGWERAYRSGDLVQADPEGLVFVGRVDEQVKIGGRRIELGELDAALQRLPGVSAAAAALQVTGAGHRVLVGYLVPQEGTVLDLAGAAGRLREVLPAPLVPLLTAVDALPLRTSGKVDRGALPWPLAAAEATTSQPLTGTAAWVAEQWQDVLGISAGADDDFFEHGGGSLAAAQLVSALRGRFPGATVADVYDYPRLAAQADRLDSMVAPAAARSRGPVRPTPRRAQLLQTVLAVPLQTVVGLRWLVWLLTFDDLLARSVHQPWLAPVSWWWVAVGWVVCISPLGRMATAVVGARLLLRGVEPGSYPRGGSVHLRLWAAEQLAAAAGAANLAGAPWITYYARALGASIGRDVDLHSLPPITGLLTIGDRAAIEPEVDLAGHWLEGDLVHIGRLRIGADASIGSRTTLLPGARVGRGAQVSAGSAVVGSVPGGQRWAGSPARPAGRLRQPWPAEPPPHSLGWVVAYGIASIVMSVLLLTPAVVGASVLAHAVRHQATLGGAVAAALRAVPLMTAGGFLALTLVILAAVRLLGVGVQEGTFAVRSRMGWQVWATERLLDTARTALFPLYASLVTPMWLRALGAKVGKGVEASTVLLLPKMATVADGAFLADDTMLASYSLRGGWVRIAQAKIGKRAFLGNSGMAAGGRTVPKNALVAVLSAAPRKSKAGSSWLGSPPVKLRRRAVAGDQRLTFEPPPRLRLARAAVELCRVVPLMATVAIGVGVLATLQALRSAHGTLVAAALSGVVLLGAGIVAAAVTSVAKWCIVGRTGAQEHPLWSGFVWRNEVVDTFVEMVAAPWFATAAAGTPALALWLRTLGARVGRGVWCESYWLPEADLVRLGDGVSINRGCVVQTHLFHDRVMSLSEVHLDGGATIGPHSVILPAASIGPDASVGAVSLVMRGEHVPGGTRWAGNPIASWAADGVSGAAR